MPTSNMGPSAYRHEAIGIRGASARRQVPVAGFQPVFATTSHTAPRMRDQS